MATVLTGVKIAGSVNAQALTGFTSGVIYTVPANRYAVVSIGISPASSGIISVYIGTDGSGAPIMAVGSGSPASTSWAGNIVIPSGIATNGAQFHLGPNQSIYVSKPASGGVWVRGVEFANIDSL